MNDKTNFTGYSQTLGLTSGTSTVTTNSNGITNTYFDGNWTTPLSGGISGTSLTSLSTAITNSNSNNMNKQVKVAVFTVERNDKNEIVSSKFIKEFWVENKNGGSVVLAAAKQLDKDFDPDTTVIREVQVINF
jgi:hypothetical protein